MLLVGGDRNRVPAYLPYLPTYACRMDGYAYDDDDDAAADESLLE